MGNCWYTYILSGTFYHGLCLKGKPWSCGHPVGTLFITDHLTEQTRTDMSASGVE